MVKVVATIEDQNGVRILCDKGYAFGDIELADREYELEEAAQEVADELQADVGDVVDETVRYEVCQVW